MHHLLREEIELRLPLHVVVKVSVRSVKVPMCVSVSVFEVYFEFKVLKGLIYKMPEATRTCVLCVCMLKKNKKCVQSNRSAVNRCCESRSAPFSLLFF